MEIMIEKARRIWRKDGATTLVKRCIHFGYDSSVRRLLPKRVVSYNGVHVRASRLGDSLISWHTQDIPGYESAIVEGIRQYVDSGDTVVIVGGGWGVSTVIAARQSGADGRVITFEGGAEAVRKIKDTVQLNDVDDRVSIQYAIVARAVSLRGDGNDSEVVSPTDLPDCDVLVLDCEGAEVDILEKMEIRPRAVLVETHGMFDAPETDVRKLLKHAGYKITESKVAEDRLHDICEQNGIYVLFSKRH